MGSFGFLLLTALVLSLITNALLLFRYAWTRPARARTLAINATTALATCALLFLVIEFYFRTTFTASGAFAFTQASRAWFREYWQPTNDLGYRDDAYTLDDLAAKQAVVVLGDSIAAGHGIKDYRARFSNRLADRLGEGWIVANVAQCGWNTTQQLEALETFPVTPDIVVLSYCVNDLDAAAAAAGMPRPPVPPPGRIMAALTDRFAAIDFFYWQFIRGNEVTEAMWRYYDACYQNDDIWSRHRHELESLIGYTREHGIALIAVVFPLLTDTARTAQHNDRVMNCFRQAGVPVLDLTDIVNAEPPGAYVVNTFDGHPNEALHTIVAEKLEPLVREALSDGGE